MKISFITAGLFALIGTSLAAPSSQLTKRVDQQDVINSIIAWINDVNNVNSFLNSAGGLSGDDLGSAAQTALGFAQDEPVQLGILGSVVDPSNPDVQTLQTVFGQVLTGLQNIINDPNDSDQVNSNVNLINQVRCINVLPSASGLWTAAAAAVGAPPPPDANREDACANIQS
jgi:hypothetical protein